MTTAGELIRTLAGYPSTQPVVMVVNDSKHDCQMVCSGEISVTRDPEHPEEIILEGDDD